MVWKWKVDNERKSVNGDNLLCTLPRVVKVETYEKICGKSPPNPQSLDKDVSIHRHFN